MDTHDALVDKVLGLFRELVGPGADCLAPNVDSATGRKAMQDALAAEHAPHYARDIAFHLMDWNFEAAFW